MMTQASGCSAEVTLDDVDEGEIDKLAKGLLQHVQQVSPRVPGTDAIYLDLLRHITKGTGIHIHILCPHQYHAQHQMLNAKRPTW